MLSAAWQRFQGVSHKSFQAASWETRTQRSEFVGWLFWMSDTTTPWWAPIMISGKTTTTLLRHGLQPSLYGDPFFWGMNAFQLSLKTWKLCHPFILNSLVCVQAMPRVGAHGQAWQWNHRAKCLLLVHRTGKWVFCEILKREVHETEVGHQSPVKQVGFSVEN